jgi:hypothetical protein
LKDKTILAKIKEYAPTEDIKQGIEKISKNEKVFKNAAVAKFFVSTGLAVATYVGLTKFKQNYTDKKIRANLIKEYEESKAKEAENKDVKKETANPSFKGLGSVVQGLAFSPVKNMWVLDGCITAERLADSRTKQEFVGYAIKEASILFFMYYAGGKIQEMLEGFAEKKHNKSIDLDARVIEDGFLKKSFEDGTITKSLKDFENASKSDAELYEFLHKNPENLVVKTAKKSDAIAIHKQTGKIDTSLPLVHGLSVKGKSPIYNVRRYYLIMQYFLSFSLYVSDLE